MYENIELLIEELELLSEKYGKINGIEKSAQILLDDASAMFIKGLDTEAKILREAGNNLFQVAKMTEQEYFKDHGDKRSSLLDAIESHTKLCVKDDVPWKS
jgi:hypothetical protein